MEQEQLINTKVHSDRTMQIRIIYYIILASLFGCMAKPTQPPLTLNESNYFKQLSQECNCKVDREIDPRPEREKINSTDKREYVIIFDSLSVQFLNKNVDSLKTSSLIIAKKLRNEVLTNDFKYHYDQISVLYFAPIDKVNSKIESFTFDISELE